MLISCSRAPWYRLPLLEGVLFTNTISWLNKLYPLQERLLIDKVKKYNKIIIAEDHFPNSGLYGQFIELLYRNHIDTELVSLSPDNYTLDVGNSSEFYLKKYNLTKQQISKKLT